MSLGERRESHPPGAIGGRPRRPPRRLGLILPGLLVVAASGQTGEREAVCDALSIVDTADATPLGTWPLRRGESLAYAYVHTAEGLPAEELLALGADGELHLTGSRSPQHGAGHVPQSPLRPSTERPGWEEASAAPARPLTPFAMFTGERGLGDPRLLWRGHEVALADLRARRHVEWRVERLCR